jgi:hypothetical protein
MPIGVRANDVPAAVLDLSRQPVEHLGTRIFDRLLQFVIAD